jgi:prepilin-type N-terminal cleavage/methylation domain-containing protein
MNSFKSHSQAGFTAIEMLVTIIVGALFMLMFYQLYTTLSQNSVESRRFVQASDLAYLNLRKYPSIDAVISKSYSNDPNNVLLCGSPKTNLESGPPTDPNTGQPTPDGKDVNYKFLGKVTETVSAVYPFGCLNNSVVEVTSQVVYDNGKVVTHATYVN